jgi:hypothetical protein
VALVVYLLTPIQVVLRVLVALALLMVVVLVDHQEATLLAVVQ